MKKTIQIFVLIFLVTACRAQEKVQWVKYDGFNGPGKGKNIVLVSGDEEYRSEEALPMLAQILAKKYGFTCTVLFSLDPKTGEIDAMNPSNIPGLQSLRKADLMVLFTRFRELPDEQMKYIDEYLKAGKPVIGIRTATHAFNYRNNKNDMFARYDYKSTVKGWEDGFGKQVLGETWIDHHGHHKYEGTRGLINGIEQNAKNPILNGVKNIWTATDVYAVKALEGAKILVYGQCTNGMTSESPVNLDKSIMPVAWTRTYSVPGGKKGKAFTSTMGASVDLINEDLRRLLVNASFWAVGLEKQIPEKADVDFVTEYQPTMFSPDLFKKGSFPEKYRMK
jgi:type 1 glutamine amidotransferase